MVMFNFKLKGKNFSIDVSECKSFLQKGTGLMFRKKSKPLLFIFNKEVNEGIHSFFCVPFVCIWFCKGKIVEAQYVKPWRIFIRPKKNLINSWKFQLMIRTLVKLNY